MVWDALSDERVKMREMPFFPSLPTARGFGGDSIPTLLPYGQCVSCFLLRGVRRLFSIQSTSFHGFRPRSAERSPRGRAAHSPHSTPRVSRVDRVVANFARARTPEGAPPNAMHATGVTAARCVAALAPRCAFSLPLRFGVTTHFLTRAMRATRRASARTRRPRRRGRLTLGAPPLLRENADARRRRAAATLAFAADLTWRVRAPTRPQRLGGNNTLETSD